MNIKKLASLSLAAALIATPVEAAITDWQSEGCTWHYNKTNVRDPTIVYNSTGYVVGTCPGYEITTPYFFTPCNFAPQSGPAMCSNGTGPTVACAATFTRILLDQFNVPANAKAVQLTGKAGTFAGGPHQFTNIIYLWARAGGSTWALSPFHDGDYLSSVSIPVPVGLVDGVPAIEFAWAVIGTISPGDGGWVNLILSGYCN